LTDDAGSAVRLEDPSRMIDGPESAVVFRAWRMISTPGSMCWSAPTIGGRTTDGAPPVNHGNHAAGGGAARVETGKMDGSEILTFLVLGIATLCVLAWRGGY
jgi:hypothetical protein